MQALAKLVTSKAEFSLMVSLVVATGPYLKSELIAVSFSQEKSGARFKNTGQ